jgi:hypothetical protein
METVMLSYALFKGLNLDIRSLSVEISIMIYL